MIFQNSTPTWNNTEEEAVACGEATTLSPKAKRLFELERVLSPYVFVCCCKSITMIVYVMLRNCQSLGILVKAIIVSKVPHGIR